MNSFNEANVRRDAHGKFANKPGAGDPPEVDINEAEQAAKAANRKAYSRIHYLLNMRYSEEEILADQKVDDLLQEFATNEAETRLPQNAKPQERKELEAKLKQMGAKEIFFEISSYKALAKVERILNDTPKIFNAHRFPHNPEP